MVTPHVWKRPPVKRVIVMYRLLQISLNTIYSPHGSYITILLKEAFGTSSTSTDCESGFGDCTKMPDVARWKGDGHEVGGGGSLREIVSAVLI